MALDREKTFANAERLLKQGKAREALDECRRLAEDAPKDLLMLNRIGDLLARSNRGAEAIVYYDKIADQFSASGFYPKAVAILKKIVKVDANRLEAVVRLGELSLKQKHSGEARAWFLQAAEAYLRAREFGKARGVYEKLVAAEPDNFVHAVRLAEARAAEGDAERAGRELVALGARMIHGARLEDAERTFKRAAELLPGRAEPRVGLARCHAAAGRRDDALRAAGEVWPGAPGAEAVAGEVLLLFEQLGEFDRAAALLADPGSQAIPDDAVEAASRAALARGDVDAFWTRLLPLLDRRTRSSEYVRAANLLERLARIEEGGHLRALEQLVELRKAEGNRSAAARAIERLVRACQAKGVQDKAEAQLETLKLFDATSPLLFVGRPSGRPAPAPTPAPEAPPAPAAASSAPAPPEVPVAFEAPAVPLGPADEEYVSGHLTEAEVFEKYGLHNEALQQLREVAARFPGHLIAQDKLVGLLRTRGDRGALRDALVVQAFARRAAGDVDGARRAAGEAAAVGGIERGTRSALERLGLLAVPAAAAPAPTPAPVAPTEPAAEPPKPPPAPPTAPAPPKPPPAPAAEPLKPPPAPPTAPAPSSYESEDDLEILFDEAEEIPEIAATSPGEVLEEIEFYLGQGMNADALHRIVEARAAGHAGAALDALEARARAAESPARDEVVVEDVVEGDVPVVEDKLDEDDLSSIAAALDAEYGADRAAEPLAASPEPEAEQSVDEVFSAFKEHVRAEVGGDDFRTHYDLGIAYKEMGLIDDALSEFKVATGAPELYREACSMLGLCHWERGEADEAIRWYRSALEAPGEEEVPLSGLRYDLAEILMQTGDEQGAFDLFSQVFAVEPAYRDVERRVAELKARLSL